MSHEFNRPIRNADELIKLQENEGFEPVMIEVQTLKRRFACILAGCKKDGSFDIFIPEDASGDEPFEATYHFRDVLVFAA